MAGFTPTEGETYLLNRMYANDLYEVILITNAVALDDTAVFNDLDEPSGGGYAAITLDNFTIAAGQVSHPAVTFTATGAAFTGDITGYAVKPVGVSTAIHIEFSGETVTVLEGGTYDVDLSNILD